MGIGISKLYHRDSEMKRTPVLPETGKEVSFCLGTGNGYLFPLGTGISTLFHRDWHIFTAWGLGAAGGIFTGNWELDPPLYQLTRVCDFPASG